MEPEQLRIRIHGNDSLPALVYLPGVHGDWTLVSSFRAAISGSVRFVEFTYPRTRTWSVNQYAAAVELELSRCGITAGWLLAESFGSAIAWAMMAPHRTRAGQGFQVSGLVLAGGFVKHPWPSGARFLRWIGERISMRFYGRLLNAYALYAKFRHRRASETLASIEEFVARRTEPDREAMRARLMLIARNDPRAIAESAAQPVYYLGGAIDPLVPWYWVRWWLSKHCPGYGGGRTIWSADHNVLGTSPNDSARQVLKWINESAKNESWEHRNQVATLVAESQLGGPART